MTCPVSLAGRMSASRKTARYRDRRQVLVSFWSRRGETRGITARVHPAMRRTSTCHARQRRHGSCHSHGVPRSDAPRVGIRSDGRGRSPGSRVVAPLHLPDDRGRQWQSEVRSPLTVAGAAPASVRRKIPSRLTGIPFSSVLPTEPLRERETAPREQKESMGRKIGNYARSPRSSTVHHRVAGRTDRPISALQLWERV